MSKTKNWEKHFNSKLTGLNEQECIAVASIPHANLWYFLSGWGGPLVREEWGYILTRARRGRWCARGTNILIQGGGSKVLSREELVDI